MTSSTPRHRPDLVIRAASIPRPDGPEQVDVAIAAGRIVAVQRTGNQLQAADAPVIEAGVPVIEADGAVISPGLIDLHLHGGFGTSFGDGDPDGIAVLTENLARRGISTVQASLVSATTEQLDAMITAISGAVGSRPGRATIAGIHLEGPFLSQDQAGAHDPAALRSPTAADLELIAAEADPLTMITLAPELPGVPELISRCSELGIVAAIGHSNGDQDDFDAGVAAGASHVTHLWSGQSTFTRRGPWRVPGILEASLASGLTAEIIADGKHLPPTLLELARRSVADRLVVVSDATPGAGMPEGYRYPLGTVHCRVQDGVGMVDGQQVFGGSTTLLDEMLRLLVQDLGWPLHEVLAMMTSTPAAVLGRSDLGVISPGACADLVLWNPDLTVREVIIGGRRLGRDDQPR
ncbi:N-acetylglucosamine-6-phosphate deacetylase [Microlunatus soli]|uniref:N-acetylglucosamine 6-phosphate deacetylase n=1 Tax=Microlunatus soli TaxID=630515 RepID=A0A1H1X4W7_9ACTN|nr:amidohydrolase family protein [Microlunatus soli]SDT04111.1 N-acetylglucosamine 6-phosphate deacetylase [Microlunatus soli]